MPLLHVQATTEPFVVHNVPFPGDDPFPGNKRPLRIGVSVIDGNGRPVNNLASIDFKADALLRGNEHCDVEIQSVTPGEIDGTYLATVIPVEGKNWCSGPFIVALRVKKGDGHGLAVCSMRLQ